MRRARRSSASGLATFKLRSSTTATTNSRSRRAACDARHNHFQDTLISVDQLLVLLWGRLGVPRRAAT
eukprot:2880410-Prymnesium_polylepis.1